MDAALGGIEEIEAAVELVYQFDPPDKLWPRKTRGRKAARERRLDPFYRRGVSDGAATAQKTMDADPDLVPDWLERWQTGERPAVPSIRSVPFRADEFESETDYLAAAERFATGYLRGYVTFFLRRLQGAGLEL